MSTVLIVSLLVLWFGILLFCFGGNYENLFVKILGGIIVFCALYFGFLVSAMCFTVREEVVNILPMSIVKTPREIIVTYIDNGCYKILSSDKVLVYNASTNNIRIVKNIKYNSYGMVIRSRTSNSDELVVGE